MKTAALIYSLSLAACAPGPSGVGPQSVKVARPFASTSPSPVASVVTPTPVAEPQEPGDPAEPSEDPDVPCFEGSRKRLEDLAWSPRTGQLAVACGEVEIVEVPGRKVLARSPTRGWDGLGEFRRDGSALVLYRKEVPAIWDIDRGTVAPIQGLPESAKSFTLSASFDRLAWTDTHGDVTILDATRATTVAVLHPAHDDQLDVAIALSEDGELLAVVGEALTIHRTSTGEQVARWSPPPETRLFKGLRWTADGASLFFHTTRIELSGQRPHPATATEPAFYGSPDGEGRGHVRRWNVKSRSLTGSWPVVAEQTVVRDAGFAVPRSGRFLVTAETCHVLWTNLTTGKTRELSPRYEDACQHFDLLRASPDGRFVSASQHWMSGLSISVFDAIGGGTPSWFGTLDW